MRVGNNLMSKSSLKDLN